MAVKWAQDWADSKDDRKVIREDVMKETSWECKMAVMKDFGSAIYWDEYEVVLLAVRKVAN